MGRYHYLIITVFIAFFSILSCTTKKELPNLTAENVSAETVWKRITIEDNYQKYDYWPSHEGIQPGEVPHGTYHEVFINSILHRALPIESKIAPNGSIIVKENLNSAKEIAAITVMVKVKEYNPGHGDWFWAKYAPDGTVMEHPEMHMPLAGKLKKCAECHKKSNEQPNDFIMLHKLDK